MASESEPKFQIEEGSSNDEEFIRDWEVIEEDEIYKTDGASPNNDNLKTEMETADFTDANVQNPEFETENIQELEAADMQIRESKTENIQELGTANSADADIQIPESEIEVIDSGSTIAVPEQAHLDTESHGYRFNISFLNFSVTVFMALEGTDSSSGFHIHIEGSYQSNDPAPDDEIEDDEYDVEEDEYDVEEDEDESEEEDFIRGLHIDLVEKFGIICAYLIECFILLYLMWIAYSVLLSNPSSENKRLNVL